MLPKISYVYDRKHNRKIEACVYYEGKRRYLATGIVVPEGATFSKGIISGCKTAPSLNKVLTSSMNILLNQLQQQIESDSFDISSFSLALTYNKANFYEWAIDAAEKSNLRQSTKDAQLDILRKYNVNGISDFADLTHTKIQKAINAMVAEGMVPTSVRNYHAVFSKYVRQAIKEGLISNDPLLQIELPKGKGKEICYLTQEELELVENASLTGRKIQARDLFLFACYTGLAYVDIVKIRKDDVMIIEGKPYIADRRRKTGSTYKLRLLPKAMAILKKYNYNLDILSNPHANVELKKIEKIAGLKKHLSMHVGRHTFATLALSNGVRIETVSRMLAHSSIRTTQIYAKVLQKDVDEGFDILEGKI
jgi:site-specific recombinase XerD